MRTVREAYVRAMDRQRAEEQRLAAIYNKYLYKSPSFVPLRYAAEENHLSTLSIYPDNVTPRQVLVPHPYKSEPKTVLDALLRGRKVLEDEKRWTKNTEHIIGGNGNRCSIDSDQAQDPYCGSWTACARGAVSLVTRGVVQVKPTATSGYGSKSVRWTAADPDDSDTKLKSDAKAVKADALYRAAEKVLDLAVVVSNGHETIVGLNDGTYTKRDQVLEAFDVAIKIARSSALREFQRVASSHDVKAA